MDFSGIIDFLQTDLGRVVLTAFQNVFDFFYPSNAPGVPGE